MIHLHHIFPLISILEYALEKTLTNEIETEQTKEEQKRKKRIKKTTTWHL